MNSFLQYIEKKSLLKMLGLITLQQSFLALGTYALTQAGLFFGDRHKFGLWVVISFLLYLLTPIFAIFIRRLEAQMGLHAYALFLQKSLFSKFGSSSLWQNKTNKDKFLAAIGADASDYLSFILFISMDIYSFSLSVLFGVLVLGFAIDKSLISGFVIGGLISFAVYRFFSRHIETNYTEAQSARTDLSGHLLKCWDNIFLNNQSIFNNFQNIFQNKFQVTSQRAINSATWTESLVFILGLTAGVPVFISICWVLWHLDGQKQSNVLIALLATLPRQFNILTMFRSIFQSLTNLLGVKAKFDVVLENTQIEGRDLLPSIQCQEINFGSQKIENIESLQALISQNSSGRFEVRGPNGSGKSTLLLHLNMALESSFYLPSHPDLILGHEIRSPRSTGENLIDYIKFLETAPEKVILLDEWDANLDDTNLLRLEEQIQNLSKTRLVIEVRHREATLGKAGVLGE